MRLPKRRFQQELKQRFNKDEIRTVCFSLGINHEELDEKTITTLTESLLLYVEKRGRIMDLVDILRSKRPQIDWSALAFADVDCPYRGLLPFREEDAHLFYGRDAYTERLLEAVEKRPLVAVMGPSGSGKSSVVFAGLIPRLRPTDQQQTGQWKIVNFSPGKTPFETLSGELIHLLEPDLSESAQLVETNTLSENLVEGRISLHQVMARIARKMDDGKRILLIVDQYEELYTQTEDTTLQEEFTKALLGLRQVEAVTVLLTMRADFLDRALAYRPFADELQAATQMIGPMDREELIEVIERPLSGTFVTFESGLTTQILDDVGKEPGNLPLLEFALESLWQEQVDGRLTFAVYEKIGKVEGALTKQADAAFNIYEEKAEDDLVRRLFVQLVQPVNTSVNTKRKAWRSELGDELWRLAAELADARLIVTNQDDKSGEDYIELAHEALINNWERFAGWIKEDWEFRAWQERLRISLRQWESHEEDKGFLLLNAPLAVAKEWLGRKQDELNDRETEFIEASIAAGKKRQADEKKRQERELAQARELAAEQKQRAEIEQKAAEEQKQAATDLRRRLMYVFGFAVLAAILGIAAGFFGFSSADNAAKAESNLVTAAVAQGETLEQAAAAQTAEAAAVRAEGTAEFNATQASIRAIEAENAEATAVAAEAFAVSERDFAERRADALLLVDEAERLLPIDFQEGLLTAYQAVSITYKINGTFETNASILLRNALAYPFSTGILGRGSFREIYNLEFSPDGSNLLVGGWPGQLWEMSQFKSVASLVAPGSRALGVGKFSPDGSRILTIQPDKYLQGSIDLWNSDGHLIKHLGTGSLAKFSPDGQKIVTVFLPNNRVILWDVNGEVLGSLEYSEERGNIQNAIFSPVGKNIGLVSSNKVLLWDPDEQTEIELNENASSITFSQDGNTIITGGEKVWFWDSEGSLLDEFDDHRGFVTQVMYSPIGNRLITSAILGSDSEIILRNAEGQTISRLSGRLPVFTPNGKRIVTAGEKLYLWDEDGQLLNEFGEHSGQVSKIIFSPDGSRLITISGNEAILRTEEGQVIKNLPIIEESIKDVSFSPDGLWIAIASCDLINGFGCMPSIVQIWDINGGDIHILESNNISDDEIPFLHSPHGRVDNVLISQDGERIITLECLDWNNAGCFGPVINLWAKNGQMLRSLDEGIYGRIEMSPIETKIIQLDRNLGGVRIWDGNGQLLNTLEGPNAKINTAIFSSDGATIITASDDGSVCLWDAQNGNMLAIVESVSENIEVMDFNPSINRLILLHDETELRIWDGDGQFLTTLEGHTAKINTAIFSSDGATIITASDDGTVRLWDTENGRPISILWNDSSSSFVQAEFSPDMERIMILGVSESILIDNEGQVLSTFGGDVLGFAKFDQDSHRLITRNAKSQEMNLWNYDGKWLATFGEVNSPFGGDPPALFSPDGELILTLHDDNTVKLWHRDGQLLSSLEGHSDQISSFVFSPNGEYVLTGSLDGTSRLWPVWSNIDEMLAEAEWRLDILFSQDD